MDEKNRCLSLLFRHGFNEMQKPPFGGFAPGAEATGVVHE